MKTTYNAKCILKVIFYPEEEVTDWVWTNKRSTNSFWRSIFKGKQKIYEDKEYAWCKCGQDFDGPYFIPRYKDHNSFLQSHKNFRIRSGYVNDCVAIEKACNNIHFVDGSGKVVYSDTEEQALELNKTLTGLIDKPFELDR